MILYFSSTGNTKFVAEMMAKDLKDEVVSLNHVFKYNKKWEFHSETPFILAAPVYAWRLPKKVELLLKNAVFTGSKEIYFVITMGGHAGSAMKSCQRITEKKQMTYMGFAGIPMPDNYFLADQMLSKEEAVLKIQKVIPFIHNIENIIKNKQVLKLYEHKSNDWFLSSAAYWGFNTFMKSSRAFKVSDQCIHCGKCIKECPVNNITTKGGKITFGNQCMFCLGCIHKCPVHAIDYKGKAKKNGYYICPSSSEILADNKEFPQK